MAVLATAEAVLNAARENGKMIATAESCTGGLVFAQLTEIAGSSDVMDRGFITYSNAAKQQMLGVPAALIARHGAVSEPVACAMAEGALAHSDADIAVSVTGVAGPGASGAKPEGMVCFGLAAKDAVTQSETVQFGPLGRALVRQNSAEHALLTLLRTLT